jgi:hypothetical protein
VPENVCWKKEKALTRITALVAAFSETKSSVIFPGNLSWTSLMTIAVSERRQMIDPKI